MNNLFIISAIIFSVFLSYLPFISNEPYIPITWSLLLIFLHGKKHLFIGVNAYILLLLMLLADHLNFLKINFEIENAYSILAMFLLFLSILIDQELGRKKFKLAPILTSILSLLLYVLAISYIIYYLNFNTKVSEDIIYALSQTNFQESIEYTSQYISPSLIIGSILFTFFLGYLLLKQEQKESERIERSLLLVILIILYFDVQYHKPDIRLYSFARDATKHYQKELSLFQELQERRKKGLVKFISKKEEVNETYVIVIGESLSKEHMGIYGYSRNTTPYLSQQNLLKFTNAYSSNIYTMPSLRLAFTKANQYNKLNINQSLSIINILNKADIETYWISNQRLLGIHNNAVSLIANDADHIIALNHSMGKSLESDNYDQIVIEPFKNILKAKTSKTKVIFVHLMGSHVQFNKRYPTPEFSLYDKTINSTDIKTNDMINTYDNSVVYNDYIVNTLIKEVQAHSGVTGFIYFSDHALDLGSTPVRSVSAFTYKMVQIPLLMWFSNQYQEQYPKKYAYISKRADVLFSNDLLYDTLIGLINIETDQYDQTFDLSSANYKLTDKKALVLNGKLHYKDKKNPYCKSLTQNNEVK